MKKVVVIMLALVMAAYTVPGIASADSTGGTSDWIQETAESDNYFAKMGPQFLRGLHNTAFGVGEVLVQPVEHSKKGPWLYGTLTGLAVGPVRAVGRIGSGLTDVVGSLVPGYHGWQMSPTMLGMNE